MKLIVLGHLGSDPCFGFIVISVVLTLNAHQITALLLVLLLGSTMLLDWITRSTPYGRSLFALGGNAESARSWNKGQSLISAFAIVGLLQP